MVGKAYVDTPTRLYSNVNVELVSDDDVTVTVTVANRQGVVLEVVHGTSWTRTGDEWLIDTVDGQVRVGAVGGCGCGASTVDSKLPADAAPGAGYLP